jgi:hypothetical protein
LAYSCIPGNEGGRRERVVGISIVDITGLADILK